MKTSLNILFLLFALSNISLAQKEKEINKRIKVPSTVMSAFAVKYPGASKVTWEKEDGNYEANWGGKSGEDNSVQFTPGGNFIEMVTAIPVNQLPSPVIVYVKKHYKGAAITEAGKVTDANGKIFYEAEVKKKDFLFDLNGNFIKSE